MPDLMRIGGVTGWLQAAAVADTAGLPMSSHLYPEVSGHLLGSPRPGTGWSGRTGRTRCWPPFAVRDGLLQVPDVPGNGLYWDEDAVAHYRAEPLPGAAIRRPVFGSACPARCAPACGCPG